MQVSTNEDVLGAVGRVLHFVSLSLLGEDTEMRWLWLQMNRVPRIGG